MATEAQVRANRLNAQNSTGPKTNEGKANSSRNATTHGLTSRAFVITSEAAQQEFDALQAALLIEHKPSETTQQELFHEILRAHWNIRRCDHAESDMVLDGLDPLLDASAESYLQRIIRYRRAAESSMYRAMSKLGKLQTEMRFRLQNFPPDGIRPDCEQHPHDLPVLCDFASIVEQMRKQARLNVSFKKEEERRRENEPNFRTPERRITHEDLREMVLRQVENEREYEDDVIK